MKLNELAKRIKQPKVGDIVKDDSAIPFALVKSVELDRFNGVWFETLEKLKRNLSGDRHLTISPTRFKDVTVIK
jgi:hypothetical protein